MGEHGPMTEEQGKVLAFARSADVVELRHLRSFVAVAEELNFRRAAERLYVTQPALSRQISTLERLVGCQLLRRSTHHVELTLAGEALLDRSRHVLREVDETLTAVQSIGGEISERIIRMWQPVSAGQAELAAMDEQRAAYERMLAHAEVPPGIRVAPRNARGVPALMVGKDVAEPPAVLYLHGGGMVFGSAFGYSPLAGALAQAVDGAVLVVDYRLAPEHAYPAALDDACAAYRWVLELGTDPAQLVIAGDSVGAGLGLAALLRLRAERVPMPAGAVLLCPSVDMSAYGRDDAPADGGLQAMIELGRACVDAYLAGHSSLDPLVSPLHGDLAGLPPLLIQAAGQDPLSDHAVALHESARRQGVESDLRQYPVDAHAFQLFWSFLPEASEAIEEVGAFVGARTRSSTRPRPGRSGHEAD